MNSTLRVSTPKVLALGFFGGLAIGTLARLWMRWISTEPEFTWSGSIFIVMIFTIFFTVQAIVIVLRRRLLSRRATTLVRLFGLVFTLPIFIGAGGVMLPTVGIASVLLWTNNRSRAGRIATVIRILFLGLALVAPIIIVKEIISEFGWTFSTLGRILLFLVVYGLVILCTRPALQPFIDEDSSPRQLSKRQKILRTVGVLILLALFIVAAGGIPFIG